MPVSLDVERSLCAGVIGVDEAGRGPLAGAVFAGAVYAPLDKAAVLMDGPWKGIDDSKKLSAAKRGKLAEEIKNAPGCVWAVASASPAEIDAINILNATHLAMRRAVEEVLRKVGERAGRFVALVDGLPVKGLPCESRNLVKGDSKSLLVAAASILAKTSRDADCLRLEETYPGYGFAKHKGYPTKAHMEAIRRLGPCPEHRRSFAPVAECLLPDLWN